MGWCVDNFHADNPMNPCPGKYKRFWFEKRGRKEVIVYADDDVLCDCKCHAHNKDPKTNTKVVKMKKPRRKK